MSQTSIDLEFADGTYSFALKLPGIKAIQDACGIGIGGLYARLLRGRYVFEEGPIGNPAEAEFYVGDLIEVIRHGLIGGGAGMVGGSPVVVTPLVANRLIDAYVMTQPLRSAWTIATSVCMACIDGYESPAIKKKDVSESESPVETTDTSTTPKP